jgi:hypothetical protein
MAPADSSIALAHGSIRALLSWLDANAARSTVATEITKSSPLRYKTPDLKQIGGHAVKVGAAKLPLQLAPVKHLANCFAEPLL